jgi:hypothetical protein
MDLRLIRRAFALAAGAFLLSATAVFADTIPADGDAIVPGNQGTIDLGARGPGETITKTVTFTLFCATPNHAIVGQTATINPQTYSVPLNGTISSTGTTVGPVPSGWPVGSGTPCGSPTPTLPGNAPVTVTLKTPTTPGFDYQYTIIYSRVGMSGLSGTSAINFSVDVVVNTPPILGLPTTVTAEATGPTGAIVTYAASASDAQDDPDPTPSCDPASGTTFAMGTTTVSCTAIDSGGLSASGTFSVIVSDSIAPSLDLPTTITAEATSAAGADVTYTVGATDTVDPTPTVGCAPLSGSTFPLGTTSVDCTAADDAGNVSAGSFDVVVADSTAPALVLPGAISAEATGPTGAVVTYDASATDAVDGAPTVVCTPASGSTFPLGTTSVGCTATDATGNSSTGSFDVTVGDSAAPTMSGVPGDISVTTTNAGGRSVTWASPTATDAVGGSLDVTCTPASGSNFAIGTRTVSCSAADAAGNSASASFSVTVTLDPDDPPPPPPPGAAEWGEPISGGTLSAKAGRTVPLKVRLFLDGVEVTSGSASLVIVPCSGGSTVLTVPLTFTGGRWQGHLDTGQLSPGCYTVTAVVGDRSSGSFTLDLGGPDPSSTPKPPKDKPKK